MRKLDRLIARYEEFHQDKTNRFVHFVCVPLIALSLVGLLWCVKIPTTLGDELSFTLNAGAVFIGLASVYYLFLSLGSLLGMLYFGLAASLLCISVEASPLPLFAVSLTVFVLAWAGQFVGHGIEGKKPAFTEDIQFLLVSPAWLLDALYRKPAVTLLTALLVGCGTFGLADRLFVMKPSVDFSAALGHAAKYDVQIIRDEWGIPHILGKTDADTAHGLAYAHAEDDFATIQDVFLAVRGKLASEAGLAMAPNDYYVHLIRLWDGLDEKYATLDPKFRAICQGYCDGLNLYASRHPEKLKRNIWPAKPQDLIAGSIHKLPMMFGLHHALARLMADAEKPSSVASVLNPDQLPIGSNFIAVGPSRSADQATRVCINSHQPWTGPVAWYEAHLISEEGQNIYGGLFPGSPVIFLGHNENIAWGHTVNQPDLVDIFELEIHPENKNQYKVDGEWLDLERRLAPLEVRLWRDFRWTVNREVLYSIYGPAMRVGGRVFAVRYAGIGQFRQIEQWYRMGRAQSLEQFKDAMRIQALAMFNTGYGDRDGNIFYAYNALLPERADGHDWSGTVPGNTRDTLWTEYRSFDQLPIVENPKSGFIQNCNSDPFQTSIGGDNPDESAFSKNYGIEKWMTNRARRAVELYGSDESITHDEFFLYKYDKLYSEKSNLRRQVADFVEAQAGNSVLKKEIDLLRQWNGETTKDNRSAALVLLTFRPRSNSSKLKTGHERTLEQLQRASENLVKHFGQIDVEWRKVNRLVRGDKNLPLGGGPDTLRAIYGRPREDGTLAGQAGDCFFQFVEWDKDGQLNAWAINQFGSSPGNPGSLHHTDQARLFAEEKLRKVPFTREEVLGKAKQTYRPSER
ncbi:MAG: penicillin acylase family protein [Verrucomicrobiota bacterium]|nr:penicillin acylase family protein [Verrucomicrobiota bacterium]